MPAKNTIKLDVADTYYHLYSRGVAKQEIFRDDADYRYFIDLLARYLSDNKSFSKVGTVYPSFSNRVELLSYCLMPNHFHMLMYQIEPKGISELMRSVLTAYSKYFNLKYKRTGPLFESRYKAKVITNDSYLMHSTRYIHMNPRYYKQYPYSSYQAYVSKDQPNWLKPARILELFPSINHYKIFCEDYIDRREVLQKAKDGLADH